MEVLKIITVLLIDDKSLLRKIIELSLQMHDDIALVGTAESVYAVVPLLKNEPPDVILLGLRNNTLNDIEGLQQVAPELPIILMGLLEDIDIKGSTLNKYIDCYIDKSTMIDNLVPEIKKLAQGKKSQV